MKRGLTLVGLMLAFAVGGLRALAQLPLSESAEMFASSRLLGECRTFIASERGRFGAANGAHDDLVMAMCVAQSVRSESLVRRL